MRREICTLVVATTFAAALIAGLHGKESLKGPAVQAIITIGSVHELRQILPDEASGPFIALVQGYRLAGDGGGGTFVWATGSITPPDDVVVVAENATHPGRWLRQWSGEKISPEMAGASGDGVTDDLQAFNRLIELSRKRGAFTIGLTAGRHYYLSGLLDMAIGAPGLTIAGPASSQRVPASGTAFLVSRIELEPSNGATIKLGDSQTIRDVLIWRHGLVEMPSSLADVRKAVELWQQEDGHRRVQTLGVDAPFDDITIDGVTIIGFHTGIRATGGRFKLRHCLIDTAGYGVEVYHSKDTSLIDDVQVRGLWSFRIQATDKFGNSGYRPGTAFYIHDGADGLQINSVMAVGWSTGIWLAGNNDTGSWLISMLQPNIETPPSADRPSAAIKTTGSVRRITIMDPRIVFGGAIGLDFGHNHPNKFAAANNNVTVIGGAIEVGTATGIAVMLRRGSTGYLLGTTLSANATTPLIFMQEGSGHWTIDHPQLLGQRHIPWLVVDPTARANLTVEGISSVLQEGVVAARVPFEATLAPGSQ